MKIHSHKPVVAFQNPFWKLLTIIATLWGGAVVSIGAPAHPEGGDGRGLFVKLELPWTTFIVGENFVFRYTLENASDKPAAIAISVAKHGIGWPSGGQPFLEAIRNGGSKAEDPDYDIHKTAWPPKTNEEEEQQAWGQLQPGMKLTWNQNQIPPGGYGVGCYQTLEAVQAHWLVGPNRWISSEPVQVEIVNVPRSSKSVGLHMAMEKTAAQRQSIESQSVERYIYSSMVGLG